VAAVSLFGFLLAFEDSTFSWGTIKPPALRVIVEPNATMAFLGDAITAAKHSVLVEMYELADASIESELAARANAHVTVQVLLDRYGDGGSVNHPAFAWLAAHHVSVRWANAGYVFHEKAVVIDGATAFVGTGNLESKYYATTRDFWVIDTTAADVAAIASTFRADWTGAAPGPGHRSKDLVWSPGAEGTVLKLIGAAHHSISLESEELDADKVVDALSAAARRGVAVHVTMTYSSSWVWAFKELVTAGAKVHLDYGETPLYIHAKALCVDCTLGHRPSGTVLVGSQNLGTSSLEYNRELSIETSTPSVIAAIDSVLRSDFANASPYTG
jgi:cardiolipin synthase A/B